MSYYGDAVPYQQINRSSSFQNLKRPAGTSSGGSTIGGNGYSTYDVGPSTSAHTPKTVRWQDASQQPLPQGSQGFASSQNLSLSQLGNSQSHYQQQHSQSQSQMQPFQQSFSLYPGQQSQSQSQMQPQMQNQPSQMYSSNQNHPYSGTSQWQNAQPQVQSQQQPQAFQQPFQQLQQQQQQTDNFQHLQLQQRSSQQMTNSTRSAFSDSMSSFAKPIAIASTPAKAVIAPPAANSSLNVAKRPNAVSSVMEKSSSVTASVYTPKSAIASRIKWNLFALLATWLVPRIGIVNAAYWFLLSMTFKTFGGDSDVHLASFLAWARTGLVVLTLANAVEALIRLQTFNIESDTTASGQQPTGNDPKSIDSATKRKPSLAYPPSRQASMTMSNNATISTGNAAPNFASIRNQPRSLAADSPLRESLFRASLTAQYAGSGAAFEGGRRFPSELANSLRKSSSSDAPNPAEQWRQLSSSQRKASNTSNGFADDTADLSIDSIDVNRAIRALSESRRLQGRTSMGSNFGDTSIASSAAIAS